MTEHGTIIIFTTEQGGILKEMPWWGTREQFEEAKRTGVVDVAGPRDQGPKLKRLAMVALCDVVELHDFRMPMPT